MDIQLVGRYLKNDSGTLLLNQEEIDRSRFGEGLDLGRDTYFNLLLVDVPRIITMIIDNEIDSVDYRKPFRYSVNQLKGVEKFLYDKWFDVFKIQIRSTYPHIDDVTRFEKAQENARYFVSVFTPFIQTEYTLSLRQICSLINLLEGTVKPETKDRFRELLNPLLIQTAQLLRKELGLEQTPITVHSSSSLLATGSQEEFFTETYSVNYSESFVALAESQGYQDIEYEIVVPEPDFNESAEFYIPRIIDDTLLAFEYMDDMDSVLEQFPQSLLLHIHEQGTSDALLAKYTDQACNWSHLEASRCTYDTLKKYVDASVKAKDLCLYRKLGCYLGRAKCRIGSSDCDRPCPFGPENVFTRKI